MTNNSTQRGAVVWFTGFSGAGKTTVASAVESQLSARSVPVYVIDGDDLRDGLNSDLKFGMDARTENLRRAGEVAKLFAEVGFIA